MSRSITWRGGTLVVHLGVSDHLSLTAHEAQRLVGILEQQLWFSDTDDIDIVDVTVSRSEGWVLLWKIKDMLRRDESPRLDWRRLGF